MSEQEKDNLETFLNSNLKKIGGIDSVFVEQRNQDVFRAIIITENVNPRAERKIIEIEDKIQEKFDVPSSFTVFSKNSSLGGMVSL